MNSSKDIGIGIIIKDMLILRYWFSKIKYPLVILILPLIHGFLHAVVL